VREQIWSSPAQSYIRPFSNRLGVSSRGKSRGLQRALTDFGCEHSFARASESVLEHYGLELGASSVRQVTFFHAKRAMEKLEKEYAEPFRLLPTVKEEHIIAEVDGTMICTVEPGSRKNKRPREWKEMRLVAAQAKGSTTTIYAATFGSVAETGRRWGHCAKLAGWGVNSRIHAVADGAQWIRLQCHEVFGAQGHLLCDFYHVSEYLGAAAQACQAQQPDRWRRTQQKRLRNGTVQKVIQTLAEHLEPLATPDEEAPVRSGHRYLINRLDCLDYPGAEKLGLPIGSGMVESGHRHILHARLKKAGTAWLRHHADQLAHIRVLRANHQWLSLWN
jgi:hypothetical protein